MLILLAACGGKGGKPAGEAIDCRLPGASAFENVCTMEKLASPDGTVLILRRPDGGFHRLLIVGDGRGVIAADGAEPVEVSPSEEGSIDVEVGSGTYRLPAKITA